MRVAAATMAGILAGNGAPTVPPATSVPSLAGVTPSRTAVGVATEGGGAAGAKPVQ